MDIVMVVVRMEAVMGVVDTEGPTHGQHASDLEAGNAIPRGSTHELATGSKIQDRVSQ